MDVSQPWLAIALIVILAGDTIACAIPIKYIKDDLDRLGCSPALQRTIPAVKALAVAGLIIGLWQPWLGALACIGLLLYFAVAFWFHYRNDDPIAKYVPAAGFAAFILVVLLVSYL